MMKTRDVTLAAFYHSVNYYCMYVIVTKVARVLETLKLAQLFPEFHPSKTFLISYQKESKYFNTISKFTV